MLKGRVAKTNPCGTPILRDRSQGYGIGFGVARNRRILGGVGVGFLTTLGFGVGVGFFCLTPTPEVQSDHFLHHTPMLEFLLKWYNFFWNFC